MSEIFYNVAIAIPDYIWGEPKLGFAIKITNGKIDKILKEEDLANENCAKIDLGGGILSAGFIDTQVNGGGGVLLNDEPTVMGIKTIATAHAKFGTTSILPTLITDDEDNIKAAITATEAAIRANTPGILGIHLEGPFLNSAKKGVHDESKFRILNAKTIELITSLKNGKTLITLAPETAPDGAIAQLNALGAVIAAGHSDANFEQMAKAFKSGLNGITHLFNAMRQMSAREPGVVGAALANKDCFAGIIVDMVHVHSQNLKLAYQTLGARSLMLVTDAMSCVGTDAKNFKLYEKIIHVKDGSCFDEDGTLAGSALDMASAVRNMHQNIGVNLGECLQMASETPARFLNLEGEIGSLRTGLWADLVHLDADLRVKSVWQRGVRL